MKHNLESRFSEEISITSDRQMTPPLWPKLKILLLRVKEESEKSWLKTQDSKTKIMASSAITSWQIDGETMENSDRLYFRGLQSH